MGRLVVLVLLAAVAAIGPVAAQPTPPDEPYQDLSVALWRSSSGNADRVSLEVAGLILALDNESVLPTETVIDTTGRPIERIMRDEFRFVGGYFPVQLDRVLCRMNPDVCTLSGSATPGRWRNLAGDSLVLPALRFSEFLEFRTVPKPQGTTVADLSNASIPASCEPLAPSCSSLLEALNRNNPVATDPEMSGSVVIPQIGYQTGIDWDRLFAGDAAVRLAAGGGGNLEAFPPVVGENIVAVGAGAPQSWYASQPGYHGQQDLFELIDFPFIDAADEDSIPREFRLPVTVAVVDTWLDTEHCDLRAVTVAEPFGAGHSPTGPQASFPAARHACGERASSTNVAQDHATHVVGQIAARHGDTGAGGLNPFVDIVFRQVDLDKLRAPEYREVLGLGLVQDRLSRNAEVFNLSWRYYNEQGQRDILQSTLTESLSSALIVAAAGNEGTPFRLGACAPLPACFAGSPNVITVVGIDRAPQPFLWSTDSQGSNSSKDFHVGGIAADVFSTTSQNRYGAMSGTSQAAPQVTATAAYLISAHRHYFGNAPLPPIRIKNRIIYTSEIFPQLLESALGGRLNMRRALGTSHDHIIVKLEGGTTSFVGTLLSLGGEDDDDIVICRSSETMADEIVHRDDLYRLALISRPRRYVIFARSVRGDPDSAIRRIANCDLRTQSRRAEFLTVEGRQLSFRIDQIEDFTSAMD